MEGRFFTRKILWHEGTPKEATEGTVEEKYSGQKGNVEDVKERNVLWEGWHSETRYSDMKVKYFDRKPLHKKGIVGE